MDHCLDRPLVPLERREAMLRRHQVGKLVLGKVAPLLVPAEAVADDDVGAALAQGRNRVRTDETGATRDEDHRPTKVNLARPGRHHPAPRPIRAMVPVVLLSGTSGTNMTRPP